MRLLLLALVLAAPPAWAETNVCTVISSLPAVITAPGSYCLEDDLALPAVVGDEIAIHIRETSDVTLDCNGHAISGSVLDPADTTLFDTHWTYTGIMTGSSSRVTVRNCVVSGFFVGMLSHRAENGLPRSRDITFENNRIHDSQVGVYFISEGSGLVRGNVVTDAMHTAVTSFAPPTGKTRITGNTFSRIGNPVRHHVNEFGIYGDPISLELGGGSAWLVFDDNVVAEPIAPAGPTTSVFAVRYVPYGTGLFIENNRVLAPADAADKGSRTNLFSDNVGPKCRGNTFVGYGATLPAACTDPSNSAH
jgi:hypothetical protein